MTKLTLAVPTVGERNTVAAPKVDTAFSKIEEWANGKVGTENIEAGTVTEAMLAAAVKTTLNEKTAGGETKKSIIATEEARESAVYGTLTTPDEVEITLVTNGLLAIWYQATWEESVSGAARAAIFIGANQLKIATPEGTLTQAAATGEAVNKKTRPLTTASIGLISSNSAVNYSPADVTTGQVVGQVLTSAITNFLYHELGGSTLVQIAKRESATSAEGGYSGPCWVFAEKGTYKVSVQYKASSGKVTVKNRKLWALALA